MHNLYTIYMVRRFTTSNYNQSEILPVGASWSADFVAGSILFLAPSTSCYQYTVHVIFTSGDTQYHHHVSRGYLQILQNETKFIYF